jgi:uncharacterized repeat protein (TIGR03847 family)
MSRDVNDYGAIDRMQAASVGLPGQRTFRLQFINADGQSANLWIEKEQLQALGSAIDQLMAQLSDDPYIDIATREGQEATPQSGAHFPDASDLELKIGKLALGYDEGRARFTLLVHDVEADQEGPANFRCLVTRDQLRDLSGNIEDVVSSGRPRCPLCGTPLSVGMAHFCPPSNGHAQVQIEE